MKSTYYIEIIQNDSFGRFAVYKDSTVADMRGENDEML